MAKKDINVITSLVGKGLEREYFLLKELLNANDCYVVGIHYCNWANSPLVRADINLFLEVVHPLAFSLSRENWLFPNPEWWDARNDQFLPKFTKICCKTRDCERLWKARLAGDRPERVVYTGFMSRDLYNPDIERENRFLHLAGESEFKGTEEVVATWKGSNWAELPPRLTVVTHQPKYKDLGLNPDGKPAPLIDFIWGKVPDAELARLMNSHRFHIIPSKYEGFGHLIHEGIGCGALVITTGAPPTSEFPGIQADWSVVINTRTTRSMAQLNGFSQMAVATAAAKAIAKMKDPGELDWRSKVARNTFLAENEAFKQRFLKLVGVC